MKYYQNNKPERIRKTIKLRDTHSLKKYCKTHKSRELHKSMFDNGNFIKMEELPDRFAAVFYNKINIVLDKVKSKEEVDNGVQKRLQSIPCS
jgi:hypothetical protein